MQKDTKTAITVAVMGGCFAIVAAIVGAFLAWGLPVLERIASESRTPTYQVATATSTLRPPTAQPSTTIPIPTPTSTRVATQTPTKTLIPSATATSQKPTPTIGNPIIRLPELCTRTDAPCECVWDFGYARPDVRDTWQLQNSGTGSLQIFRHTTSCESCLRKLNPADGTLIEPSRPTQLQLEYLIDADPQRGTNHQYTISIFSNASNCPTLKIAVPIKYK